MTKIDVCDYCLIDNKVTPTTTYYRTRIARVHIHTCKRHSPKVKLLVNKKGEGAEHDVLTMLLKAQEHLGAMT